MPQSDKVQSSKQGKIRLRQVLQENKLTEKLTQDEVAKQAHVSLDTLKRLLGTKECPNGVERWAVTNIANVLNIKPTDIVDPKDWNSQQQLPPEFEPVIKEKIKTFCGREFVFAAFERFINTNPNGYFTVVGDAGMWKSALAAMYVFDKQVPCYFNILAEGRNRPELFLKSLRQQLISRYELQDASDDDLATLLTKVSRKHPPGDRLVIVVDALDEVEQESRAENLLYLPRELPEGVYFLLTRRPYSLEKKRLQVSVPADCLDLSAGEYANFSREDVKAYVRLLLSDDPEYKDALNKWIQDRNYTPECFVEQVADKSENNFMYLYHVLPAIARGEYDNLALEKFPKGLQEYYQTHWVRMGMDTVPKEVKVIVLFILVEIATPIPNKMIAAIAAQAAQEEYEVEKVLEEEWVEYVKKQEIEGEICYSIYHASFLDFLKKKREMKSTRKLFDKVNQGIVDYFRTVKTRMA